MSLTNNYRKWPAKFPPTQHINQIRASFVKQFLTSSNLRQSVEKLTVEDVDTTECELRYRQGFSALPMEIYPRDYLIRSATIGAWSQTESKLFLSEMTARVLKIGLLFWPEFSVHNCCRFALGCLEKDHLSRE